MSILLEKYNCVSLDWFFIRYKGTEKPFDNYCYMYRHRKTHEASICCPHVAYTACNMQSSVKRFLYECHSVDFVSYSFWKILSLVIRTKQGSITFIKYILLHK